MSLLILSNEAHNWAMKNRKNIFWIVYAITVVSTLLNYRNTYGMSVFSIAGIIDCFIMPLIGAAIITGLITLAFKVFNKLTKSS